MISRLTTADIPQFSRMATESYKQAYDGLISVPDLVEFTESSFAPAVVEAAFASAEIKLFWQGEQIAGYVWLEEQPVTLKQPLMMEMARPLYLRRLYLLSGYTGFGYGRELLNEAVLWGKGEGFSHLWLTVWDENESAVRFYGRELFETVGDCDFWCGQLLCRDWVMVRHL